MSHQNKRLAFILTILFLSSFIMASSERIPTSKYTDTLFRSNGINTIYIYATPKNYLNPITKAYEAINLTGKLDPLTSAISFSSTDTPVSFAAGYSSITTSYNGKDIIVDTSTMQFNGTPASLHPIATNKGVNFRGVNFSSVMAGVDLIYGVSSSGIKSAFYIKNQTSFTFSENLTLKNAATSGFAKTNSSAMVDGIVFAAPYIIGSDNKIVYLEHELVQDKKSRDLFTYYIYFTDANSKAVKYPAIIDPSVHFKYGAVIEDTHIYEHNPTTNYGGDSNLEVAGGLSSNRDRTLIRLLSDVLPEGSIITGAALNVYVYQMSAGGADEHQVGVYEMDAAWTELGATWNNYKAGSAWSSAGGDYGALITNGNLNDDQWTRFVLDEDYINEGFNNGTGSSSVIIFLDPNEATTDNRYDIYSSDDISSTSQIFFELNYTEFTPANYLLVNVSSPSILSTYWSSKGALDNETIQIKVHPRGGVNLLKNPSFSDYEYTGVTDTMQWDDGIAQRVTNFSFTEPASVFVDTSDGYATTQVVGVTPYTDYRLSGMIYRFTGYAYLDVNDASFECNTHPMNTTAQVWKAVECYFRTNGTVNEVTVRLVYGGKAYFDDVMLEEIPAGAVALYLNKSDGSSTRYIPLTRNFSNNYLTYEKQFTSVAENYTYWANQFDNGYATFDGDDAFNGAAARVNASTGPLYNYFTACAYFSRVSGKGGTIFDKGTWGMNISGDTLTAYIISGGFPGSSIDTASGTISSTDSTPHHACMTWYGDLNLYIDGVLVDTVASAQPPTNTSLNMTIGGYTKEDHGLAVVVPDFNGNIYDVKVWNRTLSNNLSVPPGGNADEGIILEQRGEVARYDRLVGWWTFDEQTGTVVYDHATQNNLFNYQNLTAIGDPDFHFFTPLNGTFADDFSRSTLNSHFVVSGTTPSIAEGILNLTNTYIYTAYSNYSYGTLRVRAAVTNGTGQAFGWSSGTNYIRYRYNSSSGWYADIQIDGVNDNSGALTNASGEMRDFQIRWLPNQTDFYLDGIRVYTFNKSISVTSRRILFYAEYSTLLIDRLEYSIDYFADGFQDLALDTSKWTTSAGGCNYTISNGILNISAPSNVACYLYSQDARLDPYSKMQTYQLQHNASSAIGAPSRNPNLIGLVGKHISDMRLRNYVPGGGSTITIGNPDWTKWQYYSLEIQPGGTYAWVNETKYGAPLAIDPAYGGVSPYVMAYSTTGGTYILIDYFIASGYHRTAFYAPFEVRATSPFAWGNGTAGYVTGAQGPSGVDRQRTGINVTGWGTCTVPIDSDYQNFTNVKNVSGTAISGVSAGATTVSFACEQAQANYSMYWTNKLEFFAYNLTCPTNYTALATYQLKDETSNENVTGNATLISIQTTLLNQITTSLSNTTTFKICYHNHLNTTNFNASLGIIYSNYTSSTRHNTLDTNRTAGNQNVTLWLLALTSGTYYTFNVVNQYSLPIANATVSFYKFNVPLGQWVMVEDFVTDASGGGAVLLMPFGNYILTAEANGYEDLNYTYTPTTVTYVTIQLYLNGSTTLDIPEFEHVWNDTDYYIAPPGDFYTTPINATFIVTNTNNLTNISYYGISLDRYFNGTHTIVYANNVTVPSAGGTLQYEVNETGLYTMTYWFKHTSPEYQEFRPLPKRFIYGNLTGLSLVEGYFETGNMISGWGFYLVAVIFSMVVMGYASRYTMVGAGVVGLMVLWGFTLLYPSAVIVCLTGGECVTSMSATILTTLAVIATLVITSFL